MCRSLLPGCQSLAEAEGPQGDLLSCARAALAAGDPAFLPPYPGVEEAFAAMTAGTLGSCANCRYWPELLAAGMLDDDPQDAMLEYRRRMGGGLNPGSWSTSSASSCGL
jgi:hypothetical protein